MSNPLKKIFKSVKKVFKSIVKVVKKIVKSKIFKVVLLAAAAYYTFGLGVTASSATTALGAGTSSVSSVALGAGAGAGGAMSAGAAAANASAMAGVSGSVAGGTMSKLAGVASKVGSAITGNPLLSSTALQMGGAMLAGSAEDKAKREEEDRRRKELEVNNATKLNIKEDTYGILQRTGFTQPQLDANGETVYQNNSAPVNVENKPQQYYNTASNRWQSTTGSA